MTREDMDRLTEELDTKAAKARLLYQSGVSTGDIGRYLEIRYQHVYNILLRAGLIEKASRPAEVPTDAIADEVFTARIGASGGVELPEEIMKRYGLVAGETVFCRAGSEGLLILGREAVLRTLTEMAREKMPDQAPFLEALLKAQAADGGGTL